MVYNICKTCWDRVGGNHEETTLGVVLPKPCAICGEGLSGRFYQPRDPMPFVQAYLVELRDQIPLREEADGLHKKMCGGCGCRVFQVFAQRAEHNGLARIVLECHKCKSRTVVRPAEPYLETEWGQKADGSDSTGHLAWAGGSHAE